MPPIALVWFRRDLRLDDNPALQAALDTGLRPLPVYIHCPAEEGPWPSGAASNAWLARSLQALDDTLRQRGSQLLVLSGPSLPQLQALARATGASAVFWNRCHEPALSLRDGLIKTRLRSDGLLVRSFNGSLLSEPWGLLNGQGTPYRVFTPYWRALSPQLRLPALRPQTSRLPSPPAVNDPSLQPLPAGALGLAPKPGWDAGFWHDQQPGEAGARETLEDFTEGALQGYSEQRDLPDRVGTSQLSAHLHFGEIAPWRVVHTLAAVRNAANGAHIDAFVRELGWREFAVYQLHHNPRSSLHNHNPRFDRFHWAEPSDQALAAWQQGNTGVPIVDAGMRELWHTGRMHNRVRMIVASYLCKHMRAHWLHGARWFWDTLVDADLANNTMGWQWVAGTGVDAAPYFRIFNPVTQAQRFDPQARYISRWVPELASLPVTQRFAPWLAGGVSGYPRQPLVDLAKGREEALAAYKRQ